LGGSQTDLPRYIVQTADGGYLVAGTTYSTDFDVFGSNGAYDSWIVKLNSVGRLERQLCLGGSSVENGVSVKQTADGGFIVLSESSSLDGEVVGMHGPSDIWVLKLSSIPLDISEIAASATVIFPQPTRDILHFTEPLKSIAVYTIDGKKLQESFNTDKIDIMQIPSGVYWVKLLDKQGRTTSRKIVKE
jgi:hypothetical protein